MVSVDPTARVEKGAELGDGTIVGPWCRIGPEVRVGEGCRLDAMVLLDGRTEVGPRCRFHQGAVVGSPPQDLKYAGAPTVAGVGAGPVVREDGTINRTPSVDEAPGAAGPPWGRRAHPPPRTLIWGGPPRPAGGARGPWSVSMPRSIDRPAWTSRPWWGTTA